MPSEGPPSNGLGDRARSVFGSAGEPRFVAAACAVGVLTGVAAIALAELIHAVQALALGAAELPTLVVPALPWPRVLLAPALGGLLVGLISRYLASEVRGHGVPEVMEAVSLRGGRIRRRVAISKSLAAALTIGSGGSVGREGPIVQIGASVGSTLGQALKLGSDRLRTLTAAGAAGGIAAAFNAPIAGAFFALEVIARNFAAPTFGPVVLCAVFATLVSRIYFGDHPAFEVPPFTVGELWETPLAIGLGLFAGLVSVWFVVALNRLERLFNTLQLPTVLRPAVGGLLLGCLILLRPELYGVGYETMDKMLVGNLAWTTLALLLLLKPLATSITLASGGAGGVFLPSLFLGGIAGSLYGLGVGELLPAAGTSHGAYALVGMAAVLAGTAHAPITAILLAFEATGDYTLILPVMLAVSISTLLARSLHRDSIYTEQLTARGIDVDRREDLALRAVRLLEVMDPSPPAVRSDAPLDVVLARFLESDIGTVFVTDSEGRPVGQITIHDVKSGVGEQAVLGGIVVAGDVAERVATAHQETDLARAVDLMARERRDVVGVVDADGVLVGGLSVNAVMEVVARQALHGEYVGMAAHESAGPGEALRLTGGLHVRALHVPSWLEGSSVRALDVRGRWNVQVIALRRDGIDAGVEPDHPLEGGEELVVMGEGRDLERFAMSLRRRPQS